MHLELKHSHRFLLGFAHYATSHLEKMVASVSRLHLVDYNTDVMVFFKLLMNSMDGWIEWYDGRMAGWMDGKTDQDEHQRLHLCLRFSASMAGLAHLPCITTEGKKRNSSFRYRKSDLNCMGMDEDER